MTVHGFVEVPIRDRALAERFIILRDTERWSKRPSGWGYKILHRDAHGAARFPYALAVSHHRATVRSQWIREYRLDAVNLLPRNPIALRNALDELFSIADRDIPVPPVTKEAGR